MSKNIEMIKASINARLKERLDTPHDNIRALKEAEVDGMVAVLRAFGFSVTLYPDYSKCSIYKKI